MTTAWNQHRPYACHHETDSIICKQTMAALAETKPNVLVLCNPLSMHAHEILGFLMKKPLINTETTGTHRHGRRDMVTTKVKAIGSSTRLLPSEHRWPETGTVGGHPTDAL